MYCTFQLLMIHPLEWSVVLPKWSSKPPKKNTYDLSWLGYKCLYKHTYIRIHSCAYPPTSKYGFTYMYIIYLKLLDFHLHLFSWFHSPPSNHPKTSNYNRLGQLGRSEVWHWHLGLRLQKHPRKRGGLVVCPVIPIYNVIFLGGCYWL